MTISKNKWRDPVVEPFDLELGSNLTLIKVIGYPHAGNDVFLCQGLYQDNPLEFYLKVSRHKDANLSNEAAALSRLESTPIPVPRVLSYGVHKDSPHEFLAVSKMNGHRMSGALSEVYWKSARGDSTPYLERMAESVFRIHSQKLDWQPVRPRSQFSIPIADNENPSLQWLQEKIHWLAKNKPLKVDKCFVHGDHHYANLLWLGDEISAVLDWELCGVGWREFDIAWSLLPRPGQRFLTTMAEQHVFLDAYGKRHPIDFFSVVWCFTLISTHFMSIKSLWQDKEYHSTLLTLSQKYCDFV